MRIRSIARRAVAVGIGFILASTAAADDRPFPHAPAWVADQTMYEVNLRQFSPEGNVEGFAKQLPRLQQLGMGILWFMPITPTGVIARNGSLGSEYAVKDYQQFNPEFGTLEQFKSAVDQAHRLGMFVIIDWVATHTSPDNAWVTQHPDWYLHDANGALKHTMPTWTDVVQLDYSKPAVHKAMIDAMAYWVRETGIDGFRCDSAEFVPLSFWCEARTALRKIKPVFMLAEGNKPELMNYAFDAAYAWNLPPNMEGIVKGTKNAVDLTNYFKAEATILPNDGFRLNYTTNHDKNSWEGTTTELLDGATQAFTVLTFTCPGMPLVYDGQEAGLDKRLAFFDHDPITWHDNDPMAGLIRRLAELKRDNRALWDGLKPVPMQFTANDANPNVLTFNRQSGDDRVLVILNLSKNAATVAMPADVAKLHKVVGSSLSAEKGATLNLKPWGFCVWSSMP